MIPSQHIKKTASLLCDAGQIDSTDKKKFSQRFCVKVLSADGSLRSFFRVQRNDTSICVGVLPDENAQDGLREAFSAFHIGRHLFEKGVPVPEIFGWDDQTGLLLFEDCGDVRLHELSEQEKSGTISAQRMDSLYGDLAVLLCRMQLLGAQGFEADWCYDTPNYDRGIMIEKEALYFLRSFWYDLIGGGEPHGLEEEFNHIAEQASVADCSFFLHRDFQSRNVMVVSDSLRIIDFQAGRFGPLGYDLASLVLDPYSCLEESRRRMVLQRYVAELRLHREVDENIFYGEYRTLALLRNLQILGAFSFLYKKRGKILFKQYIIPALTELIKRLSHEQFQQYSVLRKIALQAELKVRKVI